MKLHYNAIVKIHKKSSQTNKQNAGVSLNWISIDLISAELKNSGSNESYRVIHKLAIIDRGALNRGSTVVAH